MRLVFASNNAHKLDEVRAIMPSGIEVLSLREIGFEQEIVLGLAVRMRLLRR